MSSYWRERAENRVNNDPDLLQHYDFIFADWVEGDEHWRWIAEADIEIILDWAIECQK